MGRFLSPDSLEYLDPESLGGLNLYSYCNNNPVMYVDPSGTFLMSLFIASIILGAMYCGISAGLTAYENGASGWEIFGSVVLGTLFGGAVGALVGLVLGMAGPAIGGMIGFGGAATLSFAGAGALAVSVVALGAGAVVVDAAGTVAGILGSRVFSNNANRNKPKDSRNNQVQNREFDRICNEYNLNINQREKLHRKISKKGLTENQIREKIKIMFPWLFN